MKGPLLFLFAVTLIGCETKKLYGGFKGFEVTTADEDSVSTVQDLAKIGVVLLKEPNIHQPSQIAVPPKSTNRVKKILSNAGIEFQPIFDNLQKIIDQELLSSDLNEAEVKFRIGGGSLTDIFTYFPKNEDIKKWLQSVNRLYPHITSLTTIGSTFEGRQQEGIKIASGQGGANKSVIWIDGGIHAREWATPTTVLYIIYKLVSGYDSGDTTSLVDKYDWYMLPVYNPDGYAYTHATDRVWRKNRNTLTGGGCMGVDLNRNFAFHWGESGISHDPCRDNYLGPAPMSELETNNVANYLKQFKGRLQMYLNLHAYGQMWFLPWGYDAYAPVHDIHEQFRVAQAAIVAIGAVRGTYYYLDKPGRLLYNAGGGTYDWVRHEIGAKYSYAAELSPSLHSGRGYAGFLIGVERIIPIGGEVWEGVKAAVGAMG